MKFKNRKIKIESDDKKRINIKTEHKIYATLLGSLIILTSASYFSNYTQYKIKEVNLYRNNITYKVVSKKAKSLEKIEEISSDVLNRHLISNNDDKLKPKVIIYNDKKLDMNNQIANVELSDINEYKYKTTKEQIEIKKEKEKEKKKLLENFDKIDIKELKNQKSNKVLKISTSIDGKYYMYRIPFNQSSKFQLGLFSKPIDIEKYLQKTEEK